MSLQYRAIHLLFFLVFSRYARDIGNKEALVTNFVVNQNPSLNVYVQVLLNTTRNTSLDVSGEKNLSGAYNDNLGADAKIELKEKCYANETEIRFANGYIGNTRYKEVNFALSLFNPFLDPL